MRIGAVLLAAGTSRRFGENKLLVGIGGKPMVGYAVDAMKCVSGIEAAAVVSDAQVADYVKSRGLRTIANESPERGQAHSIVLAVNAMKDMDAVLFLAGDQPLLRGESLCRLLAAYQASGKGLACLEDESHWGNPAVFSAQYFDELAALTGDRGAKKILLAHWEDVCIVPCTRADELTDADTREALAEMLK